MPIYEYKCQDCGELIEVMQRMSDDPLTTCEGCGGTLKKQISAPAFQFKGSGWYVTDYADKGKKGGGDDKGSKDSGSSESSSGSDSGSKDSGSKDSGSKDSGSKAKESKGGGESSKKPA